MNFNALKNISLPPSPLVPIFLSPPPNKWLTPCGFYSFCKFLFIYNKCRCRRLLITYLRTWIIYYCNRDGWIPFCLFYLNLVFFFFFNYLSAFVKFLSLFFRYKVSFFFAFEKINLSDYFLSSDSDPVRFVYTSSAVRFGFL